jgi:hypothetical protein
MMISPRGELYAVAYGVGRAALVVVVGSVFTAGVCFARQRVGATVTMPPVPSPSLPEYFKNELQREFSGEMTGAGPGQGR